MHFGNSLPVVLSKRPLRVSGLAGGLPAHSYSVSHPMFFFPWDPDTAVIKG